MVMDRSKRLPLLGIMTFLLLISTRPCVTSGHVFAGRNAHASPGAELHIGVLGLFKTQEFEIKPATGQALALTAESKTIWIEAGSAMGSAALYRSGDRIRIIAESQKMEAASVQIGGRNGQATDFVLSIPGKICRPYHGTLEIRASVTSLLAILGVDRETAVASIVAAESDADTPIEALKAQAIATRSYLVAGRGRHRDFDFCDTTHCQFLREPPPSSSAAAHAVIATRGLVLTYDSTPFPAMYSRSCSGRTRTPVQLGLPASGYPYYSVECPHCLHHPQRWSSRIPVEEASSSLGTDERLRLQIDRRLGWSAIPSNDFTTRQQGRELVLSGAGNGHGIGLCQAGAKAMAQSGSSFREILNHYYPNSKVSSQN